MKAYDLQTNRLLPGRIADRTQKGWVMQGDAATRTTSLDGRWVYTLYTNPGGTPFIHALDTERGVAHCIGIPWSSPDQGGLLNVVLTLHGDRLAVHWRSGKQWLDVDTASWRVSPAARPRVPVGLARLRGASARALPALAAAAAIFGNAFGAGGVILPSASKEE